MSAPMNESRQPGERDDTLTIYAIAASARSAWSLVLHGEWHEAEKAARDDLKQFGKSYHKLWAFDIPYRELPR